MKIKLIALLSLIFSAAQLFSQTTQRDTVHFDFDKFELRPDAKATLAALAEFGLKSKVSEVVLSGHTDWVGSNEYNETLAKNRVNAVRDFLVSKGIPASSVTISSFGEVKPVVPNSNSNFRALNRRVEIVCTVSAKEEVVAKLEEPKKEDVEKDTIIYGPDGTELEIKAGAFCDTRIRDVDFKMQEVLNKGSMVWNDLPPRDSKNNCLISGGMIFMQATKDGKPIQPCKDSMITIRIPVENFDTAMNVYESTDSLKKEDDKNVHHAGKNSGGVKWVARGDKPKRVRKNGRDYYEIRSNRVSNFNCDKLAMPLIVAAAIVTAPLTVPLLVVKGLIALPKAVARGTRHLLADKGCLVVKSKSHKYSRSYMVADDVMSLTKGKIFSRRKKARFNCELCIQGAKTYVGIFKTEGQYYMVKKSLSEFKFRRYFNRYIIRKNDYIKVSEEQAEAELAKL